MNTSIQSSKVSGCAQHQEQVDDIASVSSGHFEGLRCDLTVSRHTLPDIRRSVEIYTSAKCFFRDIRNTQGATSLPDRPADSLSLRFLINEIPWRVQYPKSIPVGSKEFKMVQMGLEILQDLCGPNGA